MHAVGASATFPDISDLSVTVNGQPIDKVLGKPLEKAENWTFTYFESLEAKSTGAKTPVSVSRVSIRSGMLLEHGSYKVEVSAGGSKITAEWVVRGSSDRLAKNLVLFIGDGMAPSMISAARTLSKETRFGKYESNLLEMEKLGTLGKVMTNGIDSIITDSANSASAYTTGQKGWNSALNVYADTSDNSLDDPKVETLAEYIRSYKPNMCIGVVTTAEVQDATPASMFAHTRKRDDKAIITDQFLNGAKIGNYTWDPPAVKADVLLGGGADYFSGSRALNKKDYFEEYKKAGYSVVKSKKEMDAVSGTGPLVGIFTPGNMNVWLDRNIYTSNLGKFPDQPNLDDMVMKAIEVMDAKCTDGFFLMAEGASVDKAMHAIDYDRGLADLLELDRTVKKVNEWRAKTASKGETAIIVTADHAQAFDVYGTADTQFMSNLPKDDSGFLQAQRRKALGEYEDAGWPDLVTDSNGMPTKWEGRYRLLSGKVDQLDHYEDFQVKKSYRRATTKNDELSKTFGANIYVANEPANGLYHIPTGYISDSSTVHSLQDVGLFCAGPAAFTSKCSRVMDNTELFFLMADTLGLGQKKSVTASTTTVTAESTTTAQTTVSLATTQTTVPASEVQTTTSASVSSATSTDVLSTSGATSTVGSSVVPVSTVSVSTVTETVTVGQSTTQSIPGATTVVYVSGKPVTTIAAQYSNNEPITPTQPGYISETTYGAEKPHGKDNEKPSAPYGTYEAPKPQGTDLPKGTYDEAANSAMNLRNAGSFVVFALTLLLQ
jgi:alkaline phosphatase